MATMAVAVFGFIAAKKLPVELLPDVSYPTLTIQTQYADAAPESVEQFITRPVEEAVSVIPGVRDLRSTSRAGLSEVILEFEWGEVMDFAALDVREKLGLVRFPDEAEPPRVLRFDPSLDPIMRLAVTGDRSLDEMRQLSERWIKPRFEAVRGVAAAKVRGGLDPEIHVNADIERLAGLGLTLDDLAVALEAENINRPGGTLKDFGSVYLVRTLHEFENLEQVRRTIVRETPTGRVRVEDVATVSRGHVDRDIITRNRGVETVELALHREGSANTMTVAAAIRDQLDEVLAELPDDMTLTVLTDQSRYIEAAVSQVWSAAIFGGILAVLVLFFFLRDLPSTVVVALSIPTSVIATFLPMSKAGVSLNIMSLGGLALGIGMLVDNSIVVLEAIDRRRNDGLSRRDAASGGACEVAGAVTAATLTTVSVFLPIVFVTGIAGQLFYDLAVTVCLSLAASLLVSLTVIPMLASLDPAALGQRGAETLFRWDKGALGRDDLPGTVRVASFYLPPVGNGEHWASKFLTFLLLPPRLVLLLVAALVYGAWYAVSWAFHTVAWPLSKVFEGIGRIYPGTLRRALRLRFLILPATFALLALALFGAAGLGTNLVPDLAQGEFAFQLRFPEETTLETTASVTQRIEAQLLSGLGSLGDSGTVPQDGNIGPFESVFSVVGSLPSTASGRQTLGENLAQINFVLPEGTSSRTEDDAVAYVRGILAAFPTVKPELVHPSVMSMKPPVEVKIFSEDLDQLETVSATLLAKVQSISGVRDAATTSEPGSPEVRVTPNRERTGALGISADQLSRTLQTQIRGRVVGQFREEEEQLDIRLRAEEDSRSRASTIEDLTVRLPGGMAVPVSAVADVKIGRGPAAIYRAGGARVAHVTGMAHARDLGRILDEVNASLATTELPDGVVAELGGQNEELAVSFASLQLALILAVFLVFVVMAMQFESVIHPFVILLSVPLGAIGVIGALLLTKSTVSVLSLIGAVMLAGIVVNNAIVFVDAINRRRRDGHPLEESIIAAGSERLRPILMTTATTVLALMPMAVGLGAGDELRRPMAITVIGGLTVATLLTLLVIPCMYRIMSRIDGTLRPIKKQPAIPDALPLEVH